MTAWWFMPPFTFVLGFLFGAWVKRRELQRRKP